LIDDLKFKEMKEFALIFRNNTTNEAKLSPDDISTLTTQWQEWMGGIAGQGKLASPGARLGFDGRAVKPAKVVTNGPYAEISEVLRGLIIVNTESIDGATEIAKGCPILTIGGHVEVRDIIQMNG
jgi:hypothetical protein